MIGNLRRKLAFVSGWVEAWVRQNPQALDAVVMSEFVADVRKLLGGAR